ncbi:MAG: hypothetical protein ACE5L6_07810 [Candidatus Bathyarchaeia archaeon]
MLKTVKRIQQPTQLKVVPKKLHQTSHNAEIRMPSLINIDPYPESAKPTKIDLKLYQLEDFE